MPHLTFETCPSCTSPYILVRHATSRTSLSVMQPPVHPCLSCTFPLFLPVLHLPRCSCYFRCCPLFSFSRDWIASPQLNADYPMILSNHVLSCPLTFLTANIPVHVLVFLLPCVFSSLPVPEPKVGDTLRFIFRCCFRHR